jgi:hypothetical protein
MSTTTPDSSSRRTFSSVRQAIDFYCQDREIQRGQNEYRVSCRACARRGIVCKFRSRKKDLDEHLKKCPFNVENSVTYVSTGLYNAVELEHESSYHDVVAGPSPTPARLPPTKRQKVQKTDSTTTPGHEWIDRLHELLTMFFVSSGLPFSKVESEDLTYVSQLEDPGIFAGRY